MFKLLKLIKIKSQLKNIIIFLPILISNVSLKNFDIWNIFIPLIIFFFLTNIIYLTNDFFDREIDSFNITKKNVFNDFKISIKSVILLNISIFFFFFLISRTQYFSINLIIYLFSFYLYNFYVKKIKYLDVIFLTNFYIQRILYGGDIFNIEISLIFLLFFSSLFLILSFSKRYVQIYLNNLDQDNKILAYGMIDLKKISILIYFCLILNFLTLFIYIFNKNLLFDNLNFLFSIHSFNTITVHHYIISLFYIYCLFDLLQNLIKRKIKIDFYNYSITNPKYIVLIIFFFIYFLIIKLIL